MRFPVRTEIAVLWGDMDALGHVNNATYARWIEHARIEYFRTLGAFGPFASHEWGGVLAHLAIDFKSAVKYPDRVLLEVGVERIGTSSLTLRVRGTSEAQAGALVVEAESVVVLINYATGKKVEIDSALRTRIEQFQESSTAAPPV